MCINLNEGLWVSFSPSCVVAHRPVRKTSSRFMKGVRSAHWYSTGAIEELNTYPEPLKYLQESTVLAIILSMRSLLAYLGNMLSGIPRYTLIAQLWLKRVF